MIIIKENKIVSQNMMEYVLFDEINTEDRAFITWEMFEEAVNYIMNKIYEIEKKKKTKFDSIYALPRGGLCLGVKLSYLLNIKMIWSPQEITPNTLIVDDCTDTGETLYELTKDHKATTVVIVHKNKSKYVPDIFHQEINKQINFCWESKEERN